MNNKVPKIFVIAGPNGAGKTTSAKSLLPEILHCEEYVNADAVAIGLSPFHPDKVAQQAGRLMLERIKYLADHNVDFAFETTLASRTFINILCKYKKQGYEINILFLWLQTVETAIQRVKIRVEQGGHDIPSDVIMRRYSRSISNFVNEYTKIADNWFFYDNTNNNSKLIANKINSKVNIINKIIWQNIIRGAQNEINN